MSRQAAVAPVLDGRQFWASARRLGTSQEALILLAVLVMGTVLSVASPAFLTGRNLQTLLAQTSIVAITAVGMTLLIIAGEIDLSVGSQQAFVGVLAMQVLNATRSMVAAIAFALALGALVGFVNGGLSVGLKINSFIVTLAMFSIIRGAAYASTSAAVQNVSGVKNFTQLGNGFLLGVPWPLLIAVGVFVVFVLLFRYATFGRYVAMVGGNPQAARLVGIPVGTMKLACFVIVGILSALSATILLSKLNSGQNNAGFGFELQVIAAVLLGGTSLFGGRGSLIGTGLAVLLIGTLNNGTNLLGISSSWQLVLNGLLIMLALLLDARRRSALGLGGR